MKDDWQNEQMIVVELQKELNKREELINALHDNEDFHKKMIDDLKHKMASDQAKMRDMIPKNTPKSPNSLKKLKLPDAAAAKNVEQLQKEIIQCEEVMEQK